MSSSDDTTRKFRDSISPFTRRAEGMVRRMAPTLTRGSTWQLKGHLLLEDNREFARAENFSGIGFFARPKSGHRCDALVVYPGGASNPIIVATRDEDARSAIAELGEDQTAAFNSTTIVLIKGNTVEIRTAGGTALSLPTMADFNALKSALDGHTHLYSPGPGGPTPTAPPVPGIPVLPAAAGTQCLKTQ